MYEVYIKLIDYAAYASLMLPLTNFQTDASFFAFTKKLHNLIHGIGEASISLEEKLLFQEVSDDLEGRAVLSEIACFYMQLPATLQVDIAVLKLPIHSVKENALIVNALQRCSYIVAQNSLQEDFGLTASEAIWKRIPVLISKACGLQHQVRVGIDGYLIKNLKFRRKLPREFIPS